MHAPFPRLLPSHPDLQTAPNIKYLGTDDGNCSEFDVITSSWNLRLFPCRLKHSVQRSSAKTSIINACSDTDGRTDRRTANLDISCRCLIVIPEPSFTFELNASARALACDRCCAMLNRERALRPTSRRVKNGCSERRRVTGTKCI